METMEYPFGMIKESSRNFLFCKNADIDDVLYRLADALEARSEEILQANAEDLAAMQPDDPKYDRLRLDEGRIRQMAEGVRAVARMENRAGEVIERVDRPNGLRLLKTRVPFGVVGVIYEARPNVTTDVFALCFKSGNACILKGGKEAWHSNEKLADLIYEVLDAQPLLPEKLRTTRSFRPFLMMEPDRKATDALLNARGLVDVVIPRGSKGLIDYVRSYARVPVIETGAGVCHLYFHESGDVRKGADILVNAKTRRVSVCNALDCLLMDVRRLDDLPALCERLSLHQVVIEADEPAYRVLEGKYPDHLLQPATAESYGTEFLDYKLSIRTVVNLNEAVQHIEQYGSGHSECIVAEDQATCFYFMQRIDAACVYVNASTAFTDGGEFGMGAEFGISTQKLHARGPMGLKELTTYKWVIVGDGQTRP